MGCKWLRDWRLRVNVVSPIKRQDFVTKKQPMDSLIERLRAELRAEREDLVRFVEGPVATLDREFERVSNRTDYRASTQLELLKPQLARAYAELEAKQRRLTAKEEHVALLDKLIPQYLREVEAVQAMLDALTSLSDVSDRVPVIELYFGSRRVEQLRRPLYAATGDIRFAKERDYVDSLRYHWHVQAEARERVLRQVLTPGHKPKPSAPPAWAGDAARLGELSAALKENEHAIR